MAWNYFFKDRSGAQNGPVSLDELVTLARVGRVAPDCLVWSEGGEPVPAARHPALAAIFAEIAAAPAAGIGPLLPSFPVWGLFWRAVVMVFAVALILPAPWAGLWFYRWVAEQVALPGGRRLRLESSVGECWYIFAGTGLSEMIGPALAGTRYHSVASLLAMAFSVWLTVRMIVWFCRSLRLEQGGLALRFEGGFLPYFGWIVLLSLSFVTIIGWAWVLKYQTRWVCANVAGSHGFEFVGSGWDFLWRSLVLALALAFLLPFPWALRWFAEWFVSRIVVRSAQASAPAAQALAA
ncbi:GYF domain-containing protein [Rhodoblastus sp.]|uniref:GYF domain-containing protein n=1 Tax=Rhodoblastus sp. TaxID=1962975 RepID=UPI00262B52B4|nr:GYF domain-containing protein [Rhodoblastus sp.]